MSQPGARQRQLVGLILSGIFPGLGQLYNRQYLKGLLFIVPGAVLTWLVLRAMPADPLALAQPNPALLLRILLLLGFWLWAVVDAWRVAGRR